MCLYGGTFDPPHYGHLYPLQQTADLLGIKRISLVPSHIPALKHGVSSTAHRVAMTTLLAEEDERMSVNLIEVNNNKTSYTVDTLRQLKQEDKTKNLVFIIGQDSLSTLNKWHNWKDIFKYCHLLVMIRPCEADAKKNRMASKLYDFNTGEHAINDFIGSKMDKESQLYLSSKLAPVNLIRQCNTSDAFTDIISKLPEGNLWLVNNAPYYCSSTSIREKIRANEEVSSYLPLKIENYIKQHQLYNS